MVDIKHSAERIGHSVEWVIDYLIFSLGAMLYALCAYTEFVSQILSILPGPQLNKRSTTDMCD